MQTMCNVSRSGEVMEHGIFTSVPERAIVASRKLSLALGVGNWKDLFPCMRAQSLIILIKHFPINMFLTGFPKAALENQFYFMTLEPQGIWMCQLSRVSVQTEEKSAGSRGTTLAKSAWQETSPVLHQVCFCRCLHIQRPQSTRHYLRLLCL